MRELPGGAKRLLDLVNGARANAGLAPLAAHAAARDIAAGWSRSMLAAGKLSHNDEYFTARTRNALGASALGENVAMDYRVDDAHANLMRSDSHRANILDPRFNAVGISIMTDDSGVLYITQDFLRSVRPAVTPRPAPVARTKAATVPRVRRPATPVVTTTATSLPTPPTPSASASVGLNALAPVDIRIATPTSSDAPPANRDLAALAALLLVVVVGSLGSPALRHALVNQAQSGRRDRISSLIG